LTHLLLDTPRTLLQTTYLNHIQTTGESLLSLLNTALDFSQLEVGQRTLHPNPVDVRAVMERLSEVLAPQAQSKGLDLAAFVENAVPTHVLLDETCLQQVLANLIGNAIKFTSVGGVGIRVSFLNTRLVVEIEDTGIGIALDHLDKIFDAFEQVSQEAPSKGHNVGHGLGLAISRKLVESMNGTLTVSSTLAQEIGQETGQETNHGSVFTLSLPTEAGVSFAAPYTDVERVLIVSQTPFSGLFLKESLSEIGMSVALVSSFEEALTRVTSEAFDHVLMDRELSAEPQSVSRLREASLAPLYVWVLLSLFERRDVASTEQGDLFNAALSTPSGFDGYFLRPVRMRTVLKQMAQKQLLWLQNARVLLAEDDPVSGLLAETQLIKAGVHVDWVREGAAAVAAFQRDVRYDLVLLDKRMPEKDGLQVAEEIRAFEQEHGRVPTRLALLTAEDESFLENTAMFDARLRKPFTLQALLRIKPPARGVNELFNHIDPPLHP
jgi:CheY-like chemotaxis protein